MIEQQRKSFGSTSPSGVSITPEAVERFQQSAKVAKDALRVFLHSLLDIEAEMEEEDEENG